MKHLRTYESLKFNNTLDKYAIWQDERRNYYEILEIVSFEKEDDNQYNRYNSKILYVYYTNLDKFERQIKTDKTSFFYESEISEFIKYSSNKISDCKEMIKILAKSTKYNL